MTTIKRTILVYISACICVCLSACAIETTYSTQFLRESTRELEKKYECIESVSFKTYSNDPKRLGAVCNVGEKTELHEIMVAYDAFIDLLSSDEFTAEFFKFADWKSNVLTPASGGPVAGPILDVNFFAGNIILEYDLLYYAGIPEFPAHLVLHKESITSDSPVPDNIPPDAEFVNSDYDSDGKDEKLIISHDVGYTHNYSSSARIEFGPLTENLCSIWIVDETDDGTLYRRLMQDALIDLVQSYSNIVKGSSYLYVSVGSHAFLIEDEKFFIDIDGQHKEHEMNISIKLSGLRASEENIQADFNVYIEDASLGDTDLIGKVQFELFYDAELGFRVFDQAAA